MDDSLARELADLSALQRLGSLDTEYLPRLAGDLRPSTLVAVMDEIVLGARTVLVALGCGSSTVLLARLLQQRGFGHLLSIEHDERTAAFVASQIRREGLGSAARVVHAPLSRHPAALSRHGQWYAPQQVHDEVLGYVEKFGLVDLLLVDGPGSGDSRYPAMPVLNAVLAPGATMLADDADRPDEQAMLTRWSEEFGLEFRTAPRTSLAVATGLA